MKYCRRLFSLLFVLALSFGIFSINVSAAESSSYKFVFNGQNTAFNWGYHKEYNTGDDFEYFGSSALSNNFTSSLVFEFYFKVSNSDGSILAKKGDKITAEISNLLMFYYWPSTGTSSEVKRVDELTLYLFYTDGSYSTVTDLKDTYNSNGYHDVLLSDYEVQKDIMSMEFVFYHCPSVRYGTTGTQSYIMGVNHYGAPFELNAQSEEAGLLSGILGKVQGIFDSITELPSKIWEFISNGLMSLFVPDEEYMTGYKDKWENLLSDRFGAVWQVCDVVMDSWSRITDSDSTNVVSMPAVTIPLPEGNAFTFGGYDVQIVPDRFDTLVNWLKLIVGIVCTIAFFNGLLKKYDEVMGVEN